MLVVLKLILDYVYYNNCLRPIVMVFYMFLYCFYTLFDIVFFIAALLFGLDAILPSVYFSFIVTINKSL